MTEIIKSYTSRQYPANALSDSGTYSDNNLTCTGTITNGTDISGTQYGGGNCIVKYSSYKTDIQEIQTPITITNDECYYAFSSTTTNYTFTCTQDVSCDVLIIGGGGGGARRMGGGGGAGCMIYDRNVPFTAGTYTIKVGKGGKGSSTPGNIILYQNYGDNDIALKRGQNGFDSEIINSTGAVYYRATGGGGGLGGNTDYSVPSSQKPFPGGSGGGNGGKDGAFGGLLSTLNVVRGNIVPVLNNIESNSINPSYDSTVCFGNEGGIGGGDFPWLGSGGGGAGGRGTDVHNKSEATKK